MKRFKTIIGIVAIIIAAVGGASGLYLYGRFLSPLSPPITVPKPLLLYNGTIVTMDENNPRVEAVLVKGERIIFAGRLREAEAMLPAGTRRIDLGGKTLVPGFNDNHTHSLAAGSFLNELMLWGRGCDEIAELVKKEAATRQPGEPIYGNLWDYPFCGAPHRSILDRAAPNNPVFLIQYSGHAAWVNSAQLAAMDIDRTTPDPAGGRIERDSTGEPTGVLNDTAMGSVADDKYGRILMNNTLHRSFIATILRRYSEAGITSVQDNTWEFVTVRLLNRLRSEGALGVRFACGPLGESMLHTLFRVFTSFVPGDPWIREGVIKIFADGAFSTRTAWLSEPYEGEPGNTGKPRYSDRELDGIVMRAAREKKRLSIHAIGDRAVHQALNAIEKAERTYPRSKGLRFRLEHVQILKPEDAARMKRLGVCAAVQPFALGSPAKDVRLLGAKRAARAYPYRTLLDAGVPVSFGSDAPAEVDFEPLLGIYYAVTRANKAGTEGPLNASETLTPYQALHAYTMGSAYAEFMEDEKGSITAGKLADLAVLSDNILTVRKERIKEIAVVMTITGGKIVYQRR